MYDSVCVLNVELTAERIFVLNAIVFYSSLLFFTMLSDELYNVWEEGMKLLFCENYRHVLYAFDSYVVESSLLIVSGARCEVLSFSLLLPSLTYMFDKGR